MTMRRSSTACFLLVAMTGCGGNPSAVACNDLESLIGATFEILEDGGNTTSNMLAMAAAVEAFRDSAGGSGNAELRSAAQLLPASGTVTGAMNAAEYAGAASQVLETFAAGRDECARLGHMDPPPGD